MTRLRMLFIGLCAILLNSCTVYEYNGVEAIPSCDADVFVAYDTIRQNEFDIQPRARCGLSFDPARRPPPLEPRPETSKPREEEGAKQNN